MRDAAGRTRDHRDLGGGTIQVDLRRGEETVVYRAGDRPHLEVGPVPCAPADPWGLPS
ncbi:hypothetical protein [Gandjariella thermophila]|uniref:hypothetical protein n=1 Tax=Gandjariella thermophila TaxID=1931992 RepID=UPI00129BC90D|nr:hypothetical protein [Gandjariella thermophila]